MNRERADLIPIGGFAAASLLSQKALRLYAQLGILAPRYVDPDTGYRYYHPEQLRAARLILLMRQIEMPLALVRQVLAAPPDAAERLARRHLAELERRTALARKTVPELLALLRDEEDPMPYAISVREVEAQPIVSISRKLKVAGLGGFIQEGTAALYQALERRGVAPAGPPFGLYHGPVNQEDDGPVEVCVPVAQRVELGGETQARELPAGRLACVTLRGPECEFPRVLEGYDAVYEWVERNGYRTEGPPREVWISAPGVEGGPDEELEIAWAFVEK
ncbi:MAG TPA: MerR family transcriptional regulator [Chloroflexaceae bacterium]|nr:MerR family transcriptional regulator [Chloroflexaceae bacterium]